MQFLVFIFVAIVSTGSVVVSNLGLSGPTAQQDDQSQTALCCSFPPPPCPPFCC